MKIKKLSLIIILMASFVVSGCDLLNFNKDEDPIEKQYYDITLLSNNTSYGTVNSSRTIQSNESFTMTATPKENYHFARWSDGNTTNPRTITVDSDKTYTAIFEYGNKYLYRGYEVLVKNGYIVKETYSNTTSYIVKPNNPEAFGHWIRDGEFFLTNNRISIYIDNLTSNIEYEAFDSCVGYIGVSFTSQQSRQNLNNLTGLNLRFYNFLSIVKNIEEDYFYYKKSHNSQLEQEKITLVTQKTDYLEYSANLKLSSYQGISFYKIYEIEDSPGIFRSYISKENIVSTAFDGDYSFKQKVEFYTGYQSFLMNKLIKIEVSYTP